MSYSSPESLIRLDKFQVFLFACPANIPFNFVTHPWFIVNRKGVISRWEVLFNTGKCKTSWGHLHLNLFPPFQGIEMFPFLNKWFWKGKLLGFVEGDEQSIASKMCGFIESSKENYKFCYNYSLIGPNSNTYVEWVLKNFPDSQLKLPWNSFGKRFKFD